MSSSHPPPIAPSTSGKEVSEHDVAVRAYAIWQRRGCPLGNNPQDDWYAARAELERELSAAEQRDPTPCSAASAESHDNLPLQLRNLVKLLVNESPRPKALARLPQTT
jgi:Protein of unknown function (DUF2934)